MSASSQSSRPARAQDVPPAREFERCSPRWPDVLFDAGCVQAVEALLGMAVTDKRHSYNLAALAVAIGWAPLLPLILLQQGSGGDALRSFIDDFAVHARSLIAVPLLILAGATGVPRLSQIAAHFVESDIVKPADYPRFERAIVSTARLRNSIVPAIAIALLAVLITFSVFAAVLPRGAPDWHRDGAGGLSPAGWWHAMISLPLLLALLLDWLWRDLLWTRFLWRVARLDLALVPSHPDHSAGLRFVGYSTQAFAPVALALGVIVAGSMANRILTGAFGLELLSPVLITLAITVILLFIGPLLVFSGHLMAAWKRGTFEYGALAARVGREFERKWKQRAIDEDALSAPDFSATTDLYDVASHVWDVRVIPVGFLSFAILMAATLLPFLIVGAMFTPVDVLAEHLAGMLL